MNCESDSYEISSCDLTTLLASAYALGREDENEYVAFGKLNDAIKTLIEFRYVKFIPSKTKE